MSSRTLLAAAALVGLAGMSRYANDSSAVKAAGGPVLRRTANVDMLSEGQAEPAHPPSLSGTFILPRSFDGGRKQ